MWFLKQLSGPLGKLCPATIFFLKLTETWLSKFPRGNLFKLQSSTTIAVRIGGNFTLPLLCAAILFSATSAFTQVDTTTGPVAAPTWVGQGKVEGHLALAYSSDGAFSPDSSHLAVTSGEEVLIMPLNGDSTPKAVKPRIPEVHDLEIHSANFVSPHDVFLLANGIFHPKGKSASSTPLMEFQWNIDTDQMDGKVNMIGAAGGFSPARYFPAIGHLALYKEGKFELWNPATAHGLVVEIPDLKQIPNIYEFSPDGHWLLLGQIQTTSDANPSVVELKSRKFVDELRGHGGTVLSMAFSRDASKVVTACEDGKLRVYSAGDWKLLLTLSGHRGPIHRAEFSPDGRWIFSAGEDNTLRIWSADDGAPLQTLEESKEPLLDLAISPDSRFVAASTEKLVYIWKRQ